MRIDQVLPNFSYGDAIGNHTLALREVLGRWGFTSEIFAQLYHQKLSRVSRYFEEYAGMDHPDNILIYHYSIGSMLTGWLSELKCRKVVIYHNITPGEFFEGVNKRAQWECDRGRREMDILSGGVDLALGDSEFNRAELEEMGFSPTDVLPIFVPFEDYLRGPDRKVMKAFGDGKANILHVSRLVPNKRIEDVIKAYYFFRRLRPDSRLVLVGTDVNMENYREALEALVRDLDLEGVVFAGHVTFPEMLAFYRTAAAYLVMSEHEGFCVPLLEAMIMDVPVVAYASTAIPGTLGDGGLLFHEKDYPVVAGMLDRVLSDDDLKSSLVKAGRRRLEYFGRENLETILAGHLRSLGVEPKGAP